MRPIDLRKTGWKRIIESFGLGALPERTIDSGASLLVRGPLGLSDNSTRNQAPNIIA